MRDLALERAHTSAKVVTSGLKANLQAYERFHIGEKKYKCKSCDKWFSLKGTLQKHERYLARERPYHCKHVISGFLEKKRYTSTCEIPHRREAIPVQNL